MSHRPFVYYKTYQ